MTSITFHQALKQARRNIYVHPDAWRVAVMCDGNKQRNYAFDEARYALEASSIAVEDVDFMKYRINTERGGKFFFFDLPNPDHYQIAGNQFTHIIWLYDAPENARGFVGSTLRSPTLASEALLEHECTL